jgi:hypothetical protein
MDAFESRIVADEDIEFAVVTLRSCMNSPPLSKEYQRHPAMGIGTA